MLQNNICLAVKSQPLPLRHSERYDEQKQHLYRRGVYGTGQELITNMERKYWVPAIDKANQVLALIDRQPYKHRLIDLSRLLGINKSSLYSLMLTMEQLQWVTMDKGNMYGIGPALGSFGKTYFHQNIIVELFRREAPRIRDELGESLQLAELHGTQVYYLAKEEIQGPVRLATGPGDRFPAHATALGQAMLAELSEQEFQQLYPDPMGPLEMPTPRTVHTPAALSEKLRDVPLRGYAIEMEESITGFCCIAAPIRAAGRAYPMAVSCTMPIHHWDRKHAAVAETIQRLAKLLSD